MEYAEIVEKVKGHPKLERLLTPSSYEFYPFRKSYKLRGQE